MTWTSIPAGSGTEMDLYVERPAAAQAPAILVLQEIFGVNANIRAIAKRVAAAGYVAVAPDLFHRSARRFEGDYADFSTSMPHAQKMKAPDIEADLRGVHAWLTADAQADETRVAAWGFCMGGRLALVANAILPLKAAVSFYGGVTDTLFPYIPSLSGPSLLAWGGKDQHIGPAQQRKLVDALREAGKPYVDVEFGEADHGFFCDARGAFHPESARQAWALTKTFLEIHLGIA